MSYGQPLSALRSTYTLDDINKLIQNDKRSIIVAIKDKTYNVTNFAAEHPGGYGVLKQHNGEDITELFSSLHGTFAWQQLPPFCIGDFRHVEQEAKAAAEKPGAEMSTAELDAFLARNPKRMITVLFGSIYDVTDFAENHPGGMYVLTKNRGVECGDQFARIHGNRAKAMVADYLIGHLSDGPYAGKPSPLTKPPGVSAKQALSSGARRPAAEEVESARLLELRDARRDPGTEGTSSSIRYLLLSAPHPLRLAPGGHIKLYSSYEACEWRYYTPYVVSDTSFGICMKLYPGGKSTPVFFGKQYGDELFYAGPYAPAWEARRDAALLNVAEAKGGAVAHVVLLAGGTGIAPLYSIAKDLLESVGSFVDCCLSLVCSVRYPDEMILGPELSALQEAHKARLSIAIVVTRASESAGPDLAARFAFAGSGKNVYVGGHLTSEMLKTIVSKQHGAATERSIHACVLCGPPAFLEGVRGALLQGHIALANRIHQL